VFAGQAGPALAGEILGGPTGAVAGSLAARGFRSAVNALQSAAGARLAGGGRVADFIGARCWGKRNVLSTQLG